MLLCNYNKGGEQVEEQRNKEYLEKIKSYIKMYEQNTMTKEQLKEFCGLMVSYCHEKRHADCSLAIPELKFAELEKYTHAQYCNENFIEVNESFLDDVLVRKTARIGDLINTLGHEMEHYDQNSHLIEYDKMSVEEQSDIDSESKKSVDAYKNYFKLREEDVKVLHDLLSPYLKDNEIPKGYSSLDDYYADVSFASYSTILSESDARKEGASFSVSVLNDLEKNGSPVSGGLFSFFNFFNKKKDEISSWFLTKEKLKQNYVMDKDRRFTDFNKNLMNDFAQIYTADEKTILDIVEKVESKNGALKELNTYEYSKALAFLVRTKTLEQKKALLKNAIFNGYNRLINVLTNSISNDVDFKKNKEDISNFTMNCLNGKEYDGKNLNSKYAYAFNDYSKILKPEQFEQLIGEKLKINALTAKSLITFSDYSDFSMNSIMSYQKTAKKLGKNGEIFNKALFSQVKIERKMELLESGQIDKESFETIKNSIKQDERYQMYAGEIDGLLKSNEKRISKGVFGKVPLHSDTQDKKIMSLFSKYMVNFYGDNSASDGNKDNGEFKRINDKMLKYIDMKSGSISDNLEMSDSEIAMIESTEFSSDEIKELKTNKRAVRKLAYILGSGVYTKDGESVNLSSAQQVGLAKLLAKVNDLGLKSQKTTNLSGVAKQFENTVGKQIDRVENSL